MYTFSYILRRAANLFYNNGVTDGKTFQTYPETLQNVKKLAGGLSDMGIKEGSVVAVADWNTIKFYELLFAITGIGANLYPVNIQLPPKQIKYTLEKSETDYLFYSEDFTKLAQLFDNSFFINDLKYSDPKSIKAREDRDAITLFTSGTTGLPKAVRYSHGKMIQGALSIAHQLAEFDTKASLDSSDIIAPQIPIYHLLAWGTVFIAPYLGARLMMGGRFIPDKTAKLVEEGKITWLNCVPTMMNMLLETGMNLKGLKALIGGSTIQSGLVNRIEKNGVKFSSIYGGTDMLAASVSINTAYAKEKGIQYARKVSHPVPFAEFKLKKLGTEGQENMGEIYFRAPWVPEGYYKDEEKSVKSYKEGWFKTGDIGIKMKDGGISILDRVTDAIKSGGEWIPSSILESFISEIIWVQTAVVLGKPDEKWGERPVAVIVKKGDDGNEESLRSELQKRAEEGDLKEWWIPKDIRFLDKVPLTSTGKVNKSELRKELNIG
ncbi:MAG: AMP-binding protein [Candidatus Lokiarchaeota archaeon]